MYWLNSCTRCGGDLSEGTDRYAKYVSCIQCGYYLSSDEEEALRAGVRMSLEPVTGVGAERELTAAAN